MTSSIREFKLDQALLRHVISGQSGTVHKALAELITNALDAGAKSCKVELTLAGFVVEDDGEGFDPAQFETHFGKLGFDHAEHTRLVGRFGVGRAQMWSLAKTRYRTSTLKADVDIETHGYGYELTENLPHHRGVRVEGTWYKPLDGADLYEAERELERMCVWCAMPITLNGQKISKTPQESKFSFVDDNAYFNLKPDGRFIEVYSQGIKVAQLYSGKYGCGGTIITKRGRALQVNLARNDLVTAKCPLWPEIERVIKQQAKAFADDGRKRNTTNDNTRAAAVRALLGDHGYPAGEKLAHEKHFTLITGSHVSLYTLLKASAWTVSNERSTAVENLHRSGTASVLSPRTLERFDVESVADLQEALIRYFRRCYGRDHIANKIAKIKIFPSAKDCPAYGSEEYTTVPDNKLDADRRAVLTLARDLNESVYWFLRGEKAIAGELRTLTAGQSEHAAAWTDGETFIALSEQLLKRAGQNGLSGWLELTLVLVHEWLHDMASNQHHGHPVEFLQAYHDLSFHPCVGKIALTGFAQFVKKGKGAGKHRLSQLGRIVDIDEPIATGDLFAVAA